MNPLEFLRSEMVLALLDRAARAAGVPLSIHYVERNQEGARILGIGQCEACRHVQSLPGGGTACRFSRATAANMALRQRRPMPFICHLGLACVSAPVLPELNFVMTLGPYAPMEELRSLEGDVRAGFSNLLGREVEVLPVPLEDLHRAPAASVPAVAEWTMEALHAAWEANLSENSPVAGELAPANPVAASSRRRPEVRPDALSSPGQAIAAALAGGSLQQARALMQGELEELPRSGGRALERRRARITAMVSAAVEGLAGSGVEVAPVWAAFPDFVAAVATAQEDRVLLDAAMKLFSFLRRDVARVQTEEALPNYPELAALVNARLPEGITLDEVASVLGQTPSAISHRLRRKFGMSFSDYVGRLRVDRAKRLFRETLLGPLEVGRRVGIPDPSNFARLFRKVEGMSPSAYRKQFGKRS